LRKPKKKRFLVLEGVQAFEYFFFFLKKEFVMVSIYLSIDPLLFLSWFLPSSSDLGSYPFSLLKKKRHLTEKILKEY